MSVFSLSQILCPLLLFKFVITISYFNFKMFRRVHSLTKTFYGVVKQVEDYQNDHTLILEMLNKCMECLSPIPLRGLFLLLFYFHVINR